jgi:hypothetical protein
MLVYVAYLKRGDAVVAGLTGKHPATLVHLEQLLDEPEYAIMVVMPPTQYIPAFSPQACCGLFSLDFGISLVRFVDQPHVAQPRTKHPYVGKVHIGGVAGQRISSCYFFAVTIPTRCARTTKINGHIKIFSIQMRWLALWTGGARADPSR